MIKELVYPIGVSAVIIAFLRVFSVEEKPDLEFFDTDAGSRRLQERGRRVCHR
jgi:hypothetical protein